jgi:hypothetical protein
MTMRDNAARRRQALAAGLTAFVAGVTAFGAGGCSAQSAAGDGTDVVAVTQRLVLAEVCRDVSVVAVS